MAECLLHDAGFTPARMSFVANVCRNRCGVQLRTPARMMPRTVRQDERVRPAVGVG